MDYQRICDVVCEDLSTENYHSGIVWAAKYCDALKNYFHTHLKREINFFINENRENERRYDSAFIVKDASGVYNIHVGIGLFINIINGIDDFDSEKINKCLEKFEYRDDIHVIVAKNYIFISSIFVFINHEIIHALLLHEKKHSDVALSQEICADCCGGQLMETLYYELLKNIRSKFPEFENCEAITSGLIFIGIMYGIWKYNSIYFDNDLTTHPHLRIRPMYVSGALMISLEDLGHPPKVMSRNFFYLYNLFYSMDSEEYNQFMAKKTVECMPCFEEVYLLNQQLKE